MQAQGGALAKPSSSETHDRHRVAIRLLTGPVTIINPDSKTLYEGKKETTGKL